MSFEYLTNQVVSENNLMYNNIIKANKIKEEVT